MSASGARRAWAALLAGALAGCAGTPVETLHALDPGPRDSAIAPVAHRPAASVALDPIILAETVDRPQFVVTLPGRGLTILEQQRWAEPLRVAIPRVVAAAIGRALDGAQVSAYPDEAPPGVRYRVALDISRFESRPADGVTIEASWVVRRADGVTHPGHRVVTEAVAAAGYPALVAAHAHALTALGRDIAGSVAALASR